MKIRFKPPFSAIHFAIDEDDECGLVFVSIQPLLFYLFFSLVEERNVYGARRKFPISRVNKGFECRSVTLCNKIHDKVIFSDLNMRLRLRNVKNY